MLAINI